MTTQHPHYVGRTHVGGNPPASSAHRFACWSLLCAAAALGASNSAYSQGYPDKSKPIRIVLPFGAGSGTDVMARAYSQALSEVAGVRAIVDNRPGAEGVIGVEAAKVAAPDGYTVLLGNSSTHVLNSLMLPKIPYDPTTDFTPVAGVAKIALALNAGPSTKFRTITELIAAAKAEPGKYSYGSGSTSTRLSMEMLEHLAGVKMLAVPYKTMSQATSGLAAGEIDVLANDVAIVLPQYKAGRLRPLATTGVKRLAALPAVPTVREQGVEKYEMTAWSAFFVPAHTPPAVVEKLGAMLQEAAKTKYVTDALALNSFEPLDMNSAQLSTLMRSEIDRFSKLIRDMKKNGS